MRTARASNLLKLRSRITCLSGAVALLIATAGAAGASFFLLFDRDTGPPGTVVHVHTGGEGACPACPPRLPLYFARAAIADTIEVADDARLVLVGHLTIDGRGNGSGAFTVPEAPNGRYLVMTACDPCARTSAGRVILPLGPFPPFEILGSSPDRPAPIWPLIVGGLAVLAVGVASISVRRRSRRPPSRPASADRGSPSPRPSC